MATRSKTLRDIFDAAAEIDDLERRAQFVRAACGDDDLLRARIEHLLKAHESAGGFCRAAETPGPPAEGAADPPLASADLPSERIGRYKLLRKIGEGGCGVVYLAEQTDPLTRRVALKIIKLGMDTRNVIARFEAERQALALMDHPNIAHVLDAGATETGRPFFVMELVRGSKITDYCDEQNLTPGERLELFVQVCQAIQHAHQKGIIHRDVKPSNILVTVQDGVATPKVIDFGVAKATTDMQLTDKTVFTQFELLVGTPAYMSPEQAGLTGLDIDTRTDIYALGVLLYELLTGHTPFDTQLLLKSGFDAMRRVIRETEPARPSTRLRTLASADLTEVARRRRSEPLKLVSLLRGDLDWIVLKALEKERARRYETATALAADVRRYLRDEPVAARPPGRLYSLQKLVRRNKAVSAAVAIVALTLIAGMSIATTMFVREREARREADIARADEARQRMAANSKAEESRERLVRLNVFSGNKLVEEGDFFGSLLWFAEALRLDGGNPAREDAHRRRIAAVRRSAPALVRLWFRESLLTGAGFSPDGSQVLSGDLDYLLHLWDVTTGRPVPIPFQPLWNVFFTPDSRRFLAVDESGTLRTLDATTGEKVGEVRQLGVRNWELALSPDARWFAVPLSNGVQVMETSTGKPVRHLTGTNPMNRAVFSPDNARVAASGPHRWVEIWDVASGQRLCPPLTHPEAPSGLAFSPDGRRIACVSRRSLYAWDIARGQHTWPPFQPGGDLFGCRFSPDGQWLATASWDGFARVYDAQTSLPIGDSMRHRGGVGKSVFSPDGRWLATASWDGTARVWDPRIGKPVSPSLRHASFVMTVDFSPDSSRLVTAGQDGMVRVWQLQTNSPARLVLKHGAAVARAEFSPDGGRIFSCSTDGLARVWEAATGRPLFSLPHHAAVIRGGFSPDGKRIVTAAADAGIRLWDAASGQEIGAGISLLARADQVTFSPDGQRLVIAGRDGTARVWDALTSEPITPLLRHRGRIAQAAFSPDGRRVVTASTDGTARIWDVGTGAPVGVPLTNACAVVAAAFSPDGRRVVTACSDDTQRARGAQMWDATTGQRIGPALLHLDGVLHAEFSPDGRYVATSGEDRSAVIWDAASGARLTPALQHGSYVFRVAFSPDSRLVLTVSFDATARVWEAATGEPITPPLIHSSRVEFGAWSRDGREVITACADGTARVWDVSPTAATLGELQREAQLLSAHRLEADLGTLPLRAEELHRLWGQLRGEP